MKFTDRSIQAIKPRSSRFEVWETGYSGFGLRVSPAGRKAWIYLYRFDGKSRRATLGQYPAMTLAEAHAAHAEAAKILDKGFDPGAMDQATKEQARREPTIAQLVKEFIEKGLKAKGNRSWQEYKRNLEKDVIPAWGARKAKDIKKRDVILLMESIFHGETEDRKRGAPNQSTQIFKIVRRMFNFAIERDILEATPCAQVKPLAPSNRKDRFLSADEVRIFWNAIDACGISEGLRRALKLILVTAQRPGEVIGAHSSEFEGCWWTVPAERSKNKRAHRVYLTPLARSLFQERGQGYLFPSPRGKKLETVKPIHINALAHALRRALKPDPETGKRDLDMVPFTPHDLRRTAATHLGELGTSGELIGKILNHVDRSVTAIYNRHAYDQEKMQALESWARKLDRIIHGKKEEKIIELRQG